MIFEHLHFLLLHGPRGHKPTGGFSGLDVACLINHEFDLAIKGRQLGDCLGKGYQLCGRR